MAFVVPKQCLDRNRPRFKSIDNNLAFTCLVWMAAWANADKTTEMTVSISVEQYVVLEVDTSLTRAIYVYCSFYLV